MAARFVEQREYTEFSHTRLEVKMDAGFAHVDRKLDQLIDAHPALQEIDWSVPRAFQLDHAVESRAHLGERQTAVMAPTWDVVWSPRLDFEAAFPCSRGGDRDR
jgi:hypothetical protein